MRRKKKTEKMKNFRNRVEQHLQQQQQQQQQKPIREL